MLDAALAVPPGRTYLTCIYYVIVYVSRNMIIKLVLNVTLMVEDRKKRYICLDAVLNVSQILPQRGVDQVGGPGAPLRVKVWIS
jgi:hypothetical protein